MTDDPTLFMRADMVEKVGRLVQPVLDASEKAGFHTSESGSDEPKAADALLAQGSNHAWRPVRSPAERKIDAAG